LLSAEAALAGIYMCNPKPFFDSMQTVYSKLVGASTPLSMLISSYQSAATQTCGSWQETISLLVNFFASTSSFTGEIIGNAFSGGWRYLEAGESVANMASALICAMCPTTIEHLNRTNMSVRPNEIFYHCSVNIDNPLQKWGVGVEKRISKQNWFNLPENYHRKRMSMPNRNGDMFDITDYEADEGNEYDMMRQTYRPTTLEEIIRNDEADEAMVSLSNL
jgi:hypothetical protein